MSLDDPRVNLAKLQKAQAMAERQLAIFEELWKIPQFNEWMKDNIVIRDEVNHLKKEITTYVTYKGQSAENVTCFETCERIKQIIATYNEGKVIASTAMKKIEELLFLTVDPSKEESEKPTEEKAN